ncbi:MAG: peptide deformylase [Candidatus Buchananbacteria bacterium RIFCSPHIGHO2_02_FULL_45_11b]|uniref:Peptide deformylase n=4 Tax=Candidatus Buchananiibacteriota TaxID=1817903 RepID=A0A1G1Y3U6_9BACT|nr:MAG: peptide deformylase [Candidatus Buchananbacteria bacterium RIFCSPHIGHO2_01_FULL_46_12]OGY50088.1 MAG: peptide deformylase [Candidatus Buchananbacteria bacterium RIFCSPHIGHO2_02_FULL_45_11b]OGY53678.1 MAG: peptide deformylase [Candidatus Buchananbacteria bacterium RIFCSPLOWO2_01_FULL_45_31]OGY56231.1 MAG: peptide deformylase [Candidatus Buchananbacteria bacterium RIFCSPLOWO2_02_FULL_46_11b]
MAKLLPIKIYPCPVLRQKNRNLKTAELQKNEIKQLILNMAETMKQKDGAGLAAPQVGQNLRIAAINTEDGVLVLINPKILIKSWRQEIMEEGCLSLPEIFGLVKRSLKVNVTALDSDGKRIRFKATGMFARVIQHELDHLDGVLFIDKAREITQGGKILEKAR